jgi:hypothetical protein
MIDRARRAHGLGEQPVEHLAATLLRGFFADATDGSVSRRNAINAVCRSLGAAGRERATVARLYAEGWQLLELAGLICRDPEQPQGDWWFLTRAGRAALGEGRVDEVLRSAAA